MDAIREMTMPVDKRKSIKEILEKIPKGEISTKMANFI
jgi:hypothetical protein